MALSQKTTYALRALFELARHDGVAPVKIGHVAEAQGLPVRFLEGILNQLKQAGFVNSKRGVEGGYYLAKPAGTIALGDVIRFLEGPLCPVECRPGHPDDACALSPESCPFRSVWERAERALAAVYDGTTLEDLVVAAGKAEPLNYAI